MSLNGGSRQHRAPDRPLSLHISGIAGNDLREVKAVDLVVSGRPFWPNFTCHCKHPVEIDRLKPREEASS